MRIDPHFNPATGTVDGAFSLALRDSGGSKKKPAVERGRAGVFGRAFKATEGMRPVVAEAIRSPRALACNGGALLANVRRATLAHDTAEDQQDCVAG